MIIASAYLALPFFGVLAVVGVAAGHVAVHPAQGLGLMLLEVALLVTVTIAGGTRLGTVANGVLALGFYGLGFIGGWIEQIGALVGIQSAKTIGIAVSLLSPADALWRMAAFHLQPPIVRQMYGETAFAADGRLGGRIPGRHPGVWRAVVRAAHAVGAGRRSSPE